MTISESQHRQLLYLLQEIAREAQGKNRALRIGNLVRRSVLILKNARRRYDRSGSDSYAGCQ